MTAYTGKRIIVGICGSIAAFKVAGWVSTLAKAEAQVSVVMSDAATRFITPLTFSALTGNQVYTDMFAESNSEAMAHINLGREADLIVIAPASAQKIAQLANGMAGDLLTTTILAARCPVVICPAMNSSMLNHQATQRNISRLQEYGYTLIDPAEGMMACKEEGRGRLPEWELVDSYLRKHLSVQDLAGKKVLVTAGPTREHIDPARYLSNRSSGKMGYAIAQNAFQRGAEVVLVAGPSTLDDPPGIRCLHVQSACEMYDVVMEHAETSDVIVKAAAVADYRAKHFSGEKIKKHHISEHLELEKNPDILSELGKNKRKGQVLVGFAAESSKLEEEGRRKLKNKNLDMIAVNDICSESTGFAADTNQLLLIYGDKTECLPFASKETSAKLLLDAVVNIQTE